MKQRVVTITGYIKVMLDEDEVPEMYEQDEEWCARTFREFVDDEDRGFTITEVSVKEVI